MDLKEFTKGYIQCALWSSTDCNENFLDENHSAEDLSDEAVKKTSEDCTKFITDNFCLLQKSGMSAATAGHNFWLTRNGHGAGFWDRGLGEVGNELTRSAEKHGECRLFLSGGKIEAE